LCSILLMFCLFVRRYFFLVAITHLAYNIQYYIHYNIILYYTLTELCLLRALYFTINSFTLELTYHLKHVPYYDPLPHVRKMLLLLCFVLPPWILPCLRTVRSRINILSLSTKCSPIFVCILNCIYHLMHMLFCVLDIFFYLYTALYLII